MRPLAAGLAAGLAALLLLSACDRGETSGEASSAAPKRTGSAIDSAILPTSCRRPAVKQVEGSG